MECFFLRSAFLACFFFYILHKNYIYIELDSISHGHLLHISGIPFHFHISFWTRMMVRKLFVICSTQNQMELEHYHRVYCRAMPCHPHWSEANDSKKSKSSTIRKPIHISSLMCSVCWFSSRFASPFSRTFILFTTFCICTRITHVWPGLIHIVDMLSSLLLCVLCGANADFPFSLFNSL